MNLRDRSLPGLDDCVHCGLCLPVCPTYAIDRRESQNPRGRIAALRAIDEGRVALSPALREGLEDCLVCRACESACPSGISMEGLMLSFRDENRREGCDGRTRLERFALDRIVASPGILERALGLVRGGLAVIPARWRGEGPRRERLRPANPPEVIEPESDPSRGTVSLLRGCLADRVQAHETMLAARLLARFGFRVHLGSAGCCGALHRHAGLADTSLTLSRTRAADLLENDPDHIIVDSAGCGSALREPLSDDTALHSVAARVTDTPQLLATLDLPPPTDPILGPVAFFPPCHQSHGTGTVAATRRVLEHVVDGEVLALPGEEMCCGAAGTYLFRRPEKSRDLGERALERWRRGGRPSTLATGNPGCLLRWESLIAAEMRREGSSAAAETVEVAHPVTLIARAYGLSADG